MEPRDAIRHAPLQQPYQPGNPPVEHPKQKLRDKLRESSERALKQPPPTGTKIKKASLPEKFSASITKAAQKLGNMINRATFGAAVTSKTRKDEPSDTSSLAKEKDALVKLHKELKKLETELEWSGSTKTYHDLSTLKDNIQRSKNKIRDQEISISKITRAAKENPEVPTLKSIFESAKLAGAHEYFSTASFASNTAKELGLDDKIPKGEKHKQAEAEPAHTQPALDLTRTVDLDRLILEEEPVIESLEDLLNDPDLHLEVGAPVDESKEAKKEDPVQPAYEDLYCKLLELENALKVVSKGSPKARELKDEILCLEHDLAILEVRLAEQVDDGMNARKTITGENDRDLEEDRKDHFQGLVEVVKLEGALKFIARNTVSAKEVVSLLTPEEILGAAERMEQTANKLAYNIGKLQKLERELAYSFPDSERQRIIFYEMQRVKSEIAKEKTQLAVLCKAGNADYESILKTLPERKNYRSGDIDISLKLLDNIALNDYLQLPKGTPPPALTAQEELMIHLERLPCIHKEMDHLQKNLSSEENRIKYTDLIRTIQASEAIIRRLLSDEPLRSSLASIFGSEDASVIRTGRFAEAKYVGDQGTDREVSAARQRKISQLELLAKVYSYPGVKEALAFSDRHEGETVVTMFGGDNAEQLRRSVAVALSQTNPEVETEFNLLTGDTVDNMKKITEALKEEKGRKVGCTIAANDSLPFSVWKVGKGTQEEAVARRANFQALVRQFRDIRGDSPHHIPLMGTMYATEAVFMDPGTKTGETWFTGDVSFVAALDLRAGSDDYEFIHQEAMELGISPKQLVEEITRLKYAALFGSFVQNGVTDVLISLPGMGSFNNDVTLIQKVLKELLFDEGAPFAGRFHSVNFNVFSPAATAGAADQRVAAMLSTFKDREGNPVVDRSAFLGEDIAVTDTGDINDMGGRHLRQVAREDGYVAFYKTGPTGFLGNFAPAKIHLWGKNFQCAEAAFQWRKYDLAGEAARESEDPKMKEAGERLLADPRFHELETATGSRAFKLRQLLDKDYPNVWAPKWKEGARDVVMREVVKAKFEQNPELMSKLGETGSAYLLEHNEVEGRDTHWSDDKTGKGKNMLGQILMEVRSEKFNDPTLIETSQAKRQAYARKYDKETKAHYDIYGKKASRKR